MHKLSQNRLRKFYDQALLNPELLCLSCAHSAWNQGAGRCSPELRQDCTMFVCYMVGQLNANAQAAATPAEAVQTAQL